MLDEKITDEMINELYDAFIALKTREECFEFLEDLCTKKEVGLMAQRLSAAKLIKDGATYNEVIEKTEISSATLSRVSRALKYGKGYKMMLKKLLEK